MIAFLRGKVVNLTPTELLLDVHDVGYVIQISLNTYSSFQDTKEIFVHTWLSIREDAHVLFGFSDLRERVVFQHLISVNGIGPNTARTILSYASPDELIQHISNSEIAQIQRIKGIGPKTAQRIILELKEKFIKELGAPTDLTDLNNNAKEEALLALVALGFPKAQIEKILLQIMKTSANNLSVEELIKQALKSV